MPATRDSWDDDDDDDSTIECPACHASIYEDAEQCPRCGHYLSLEDEAVRSRKPVWIVVGVLACLFAIYCWIVR